MQERISSICATCIQQQQHCHLEIPWFNLPYSNRRPDQGSRLQRQQCGRGEDDSRRSPKHCLSFFQWKARLNTSKYSIIYSPHSSLAPNLSYVPRINLLIWTSLVSFTTGEGENDVDRSVWMHSQSFFRMTNEIHTVFENPFENHMNLQRLLTNWTLKVAPDRHSGYLFLFLFFGLSSNSDLPSEYLHRLSR